MNRVPEVELHRRRIDGVFTRAQGLARGSTDLETQADYARYLCVLVSGWVDKTVARLVVAHAQDKCSKPVRSYIDASLKRLNNISRERLLTTMGMLDKGWQDQLERRLSDSATAALNSVVGLRNDIAHGGGGSLTLVGVSKYWTEVQGALEEFENILFVDPRPPVPPAPKRRATK